MIANTSTRSSGLSRPKEYKFRMKPIHWTAFVTFVIIVFVIYKLKDSRSKDVRPFVACQENLLGIGSEVSTSLPKLQLPAFSAEEFASLCYPKLEVNVSIGHVFSKIKLMSESYNDVCRTLYETFHRIYDIQKIDGALEMPGPFQAEVRQWLKNDESLFMAMNHQEIFKVQNKFMSEASVFNLLRSKRPVSKPKEDPVSYIKKLVKETEGTCDFCKYKTNTAEDVFGRVENEFSASSSNAFKLAKFHGLFFPKLHNPLEISLETLRDLFLKTMPTWYSKAVKQDASYTYPTLLWDMLPHAGASQVHPHIHGLLDKHQYSGQFETFRSGTHSYFQKYNKLLWSDMLEVHYALGLAVVQGRAVAIVPITARKDHEFMILSDSLNDDVIVLMHKILTAYQKHLGVYCFSAGGALPVIKAPLSGLPFVFRIGSRGVCSSVGSDVSSLELYTINNINSDIAKTLEALKQASSSLS